MTNREFYQFIITNVEDEAIVTHAKEALASLDARNAKRNTQKSAKREAEYTPIEESIVAVLNETAQTTSEIASKVGLTTSKVSPRCKALVEKGLAVEVEVKVPKVGLRKAYAKA